jgi:hypothetical protein
MSDMSNDYLDLAEPVFEAPPVFADQDERRMHVRAYNYWASLLHGREFPSVTDLEPDNLDDFSPHSVLLDFTRNRENPRLRFIGRSLRAECGLAVSDVELANVPRQSLLSRLTDHFFEIIANRAPIGFEAEFVSQRGNNTMYRGILMPLSSDGQSIDFIYGVINWKELAGPAFDEQLRLEAAQVASEVAPRRLELPDLGDADVFSEPGATAPRADAGLADRLAFARSNAEAAKSSEQRSRAALYRALSDAYDFHLAAAADPDAYAEILEDAGLTPQARAPMTPIVKLVFGIEYDKARLTEFAAALSYAAREKVAAGGFAALVESYAGGLKGLVRAERVVRRAETDRPQIDRVAAARDRLRTAPVLASVTLDAEEEFVLLVARRAPSGEFEVVEAVPHTPGLIDGAMRKLAD